MNMRLLLFPLFFMVALSATAQPAFTRQMDNADDYIAFNLAVDEVSDIALLMYDPVLHSSNLYYAYLAPPYEEVKAYRMFKPGLVFSFPLNFLIGDDYLISQHTFGWGGDLSGSGVFYMDTSLQNYWMYYKHYYGQGFFDQFASGDILVFNGIVGNSATYSSNSVEAFVLSQEGNFLFQQGLEFFIDGFTYSVFVEEIEIDKQSDMVYALLTFSGSGGSPLGSILLVLDSSLNVLSSVRIPDYRYHELSVSAENNRIYLLGEYEDEPIPGLDGGALVAAFDLNLNLQWSKLYYAEHFDYKTTSLNVKSDGLPILAYSTEGNFPTILANLDENGLVGQQTGYPFYEPIVRVMSDGALALVSNFGQNFEQIAFVKTDSEGNLDACDVFSTCLLSEDLPLTLADVEVDTFSVTPMEEVVVVVQPWQFIFEDGCEVPPAPSPVFSFPDTLCVGECAGVEDTHNADAHGVAWLLSGPDGVLEEQEGYLYFSYCFDQPGVYELTQTVWFLGCPYSHTRQVVVLDELSGSIMPEGILCEEPPVSLSANASRPLTDYSWSDGSSGSELQAVESGFYWLEAGDGYCEFRDTVEITFLQDLLTEGEALLLPEDSSLCQRFFPYELKPYSPYTNTFLLPAVSTTEADSFSLWSPGEYEVVADVFGCEVKDTFSLSINDCTAHVYMPSAFSPDGDGINDVFSPAGLLAEPSSSDGLFKEFSGIRLQIYDRWGNLLFSTEERPFVWNGRDALDRKAPPGVYVYVFDYLNLLAGETERLSGEVHLIR